MKSTINTSLSILAFIFITLNGLSQPVIHTFMPASATAGSTVIISGSGFNSNAANNIVFFGNIRATVSSASATTLNVIVPVGAGFCPLSVTVNNLTAYSSQSFSMIFEGGVITPGTFRYAAKADSVYDMETNDLAVADLDGDGKHDIAVVDRLTNTASVYRNTSSVGVISFTARTDFTAGTSPQELTIADIDSDGMPDLIVSNRNSNTISILKNSSTIGNISFLPKQDFVTAARPSGIAVKDIDGDGKPDLAISNINFSETISLFRNTTSNGTISFAQKIDYSLGGGSSAIMLADIDGDNKQDLIATSFAANSLSVFRNNSTPGSISFEAPVVDMTETFADRFAVGDLDLDGKPDIVVTNFYKANFSVFRNNSVGSVISFSRSDYASGNNPDDVSISDVDGDGKLDLVILNTYESLAVLRNISTPGNLNLSSAIKLPSSLIVNHIASADFDGDTKPDVAAITGLSRLLFFKNYVDAPYISSISKDSATQGSQIIIGGENFTGATAVSFGNTPASSFSVLSSNSINSTVGFGSSGNVSISTSKGTGTFKNFVYLSPPVIHSFSPATAGSDSTVVIKGAYFTNATTVHFGQSIAKSFIVSSDSVITAVVGNGSSGNVYISSVYGTDSIAGFVYIPPPVISSFSPDTATKGTTVTINGSNFSNASQVNFGGYPAASYTIVSSNVITAVVQTAVSGDVSIRTPGGIAVASGFFFPPPVITSFNPKTGAVGSAVTISGTGFATIPDNNYVLFGSVRAKVISASFNSLVVEVPAGATFRNVSVTVNRLISYANAPFVTTFPGADNFSATSFTRIFDTTQTPSAYNFTVNDFNDDGKPDIILLNNTVSIFQNTGADKNILFAPRINLTAGTAPVGSTSVDIDGDNKQDILVANYSSQFFSFFKNTSPSNGNISFTAAINFPVSSGKGCDITATDFDGDGRADVALITQYPHLLSIYRNTSAHASVSFDTKVDYSIGEWFVNRPSKIAIADIDGDSKPDIAIADQVSNRIFIFKNTSSTGSISFAARLDLVVTHPSFGITIGDIDGDGKPEIITAEDRDAVSVLKNTSSLSAISFSPPLLLTAGYNPVAVALNDLNGDGKLDLAVLNSSGASVSIFKNASTTGSIMFESKVDYEAGGGALDIAIADFNGDGMPDITSANFIANSFTFLKNTIVGPHIISASPITATAGTTVTIYGVNFSNTTSVLFGGIPATSFTVISPTTITAIVPQSSSGNITVTTTTGSSSLPGFQYQITTAINDISLNHKLITASPNPARDIILIKHPASHSVATVSLINVTGSQLKSVNVERNSKQTYLQIKGLPTGMYKLIWLDGRNRLTTSVVIVK